MSYLKQFARNKRTKGKTEILTARLPADLYKNFKSYCDELGLSISEAVNLLIDKEISGLNTKRIQKESFENTREEVASTSEVIPYAELKPLESKPNTKRVQTGRFITNEWNVDGDLPCPICETWFSKSNFSRHAKGHEMSTEEIFTTHKEKADRMVKERKGHQA
jgi:antitoxin component of RelBE/YafQ-DinJ toxin-antitoxin module